MKRILVTGANGQIGSELVEYLQKLYGIDNVIATDIKDSSVNSGIYEHLDVLDYPRFLEIAKQYQVDTIMHLAAALSFVAEQKPVWAFHLNVQGLINSLEVAKEVGAQHFCPSSIGAFGPSTPAVNTPQVTIQDPTTIYGISKVTGELLSNYYFDKYKVDTRGVRFPGLISYKALPGGGTTDYAVEIYYEALRKHKYTCYLKEDTYLDMMYMPDALKAIVDLMETDSDKLTIRNAYNLSAFSVTPRDFEKSIQKVMPEFKMHYQVDPLRQGIADSWPDKLEVTVAQVEFGFTCEYDLDKMTQDMIYHLNMKEI